MTKLKSGTDRAQCLKMHNDDLPLIDCDKESHKDIELLYRLDAMDLVAKFINSDI